MTTRNWIIVFIVITFASVVNAETKVVVVPLAGEDAIPSSYLQSEDINTGAHDILTGPAFPLGIPIGPAVVVNKQFNDTVIEAYFMSAAKTDSISNEVASPFVRFSLLANGEPPGVGNQAGLTNDRKEDHLSVISVFENLPKGKHVIQVYVKTNSIALGVELDPDGLGGKIIVKELQ